MGSVEEMTEDEFKTNYVRSYLAAYKSSVSFQFIFRSAADQEELLATAKQYAERAWQEYRHANGSLD